VSIQVHKGNPVTTQDLGLWHGDIVTMIQECPEPKISWRGAPIPASFFSQMLGFFRYTLDKYNSEAMVRLAYNPESKEWKMICYPQTVKPGLEVKEITDLTNEQKEIREKMSEPLQQGFMENGSSHSHCNASAFQSGTDLANELKNTGVHITLGNVNSNEPSVHGRVSFRGIMYKINWAEWFEGWPSDMEGRTDTFKLIPGSDLSFPDDWKSCCFEPPPPAKTFGFEPTIYHGAHSHTKYSYDSYDSFDSIYSLDDYDLANFMDDGHEYAKQVSEDDIPAMVKTKAELESFYAWLWAYWFSDPSPFRRMVYNVVVKDIIDLTNVNKVIHEVQNDYYPSWIVNEVEEAIDAAESAFQSLSGIDVSNDSLGNLVKIIHGELTKTLNMQRKV